MVVVLVQTRPIVVLINRLVAAEPVLVITDVTHQPVLM
jgi:hypothetical protein